MMGAETATMVETAPGSAAALAAAVSKAAPAAKAAPAPGLPPPGLPAPSPAVKAPPGYEARASIARIEMAIWSNGQNIKRLELEIVEVKEAMVVMVDEVMVFWHGQNKKILEMLKAQGEQNTEMLKLLSKRETASSNNLVDMRAGSPRPCGA